MNKMMRRTNTAELEELSSGSLPHIVRGGRGGRHGVDDENSDDDGNATFFVWLHVKKACGDCSTSGESKSTLVG